MKEIKPNIQKLEWFWVGDCLPDYGRKVLVRRPAGHGTYEVAVRLETKAKNQEFKVSSNMGCYRYGINKDGYAGFIMHWAYL